MKYIKKFNENMSDDARLDFIQFSNDYLAYLKDDGLRFYVGYLDYSTIDFDKNKKPYVDVAYHTNSKWSDISDSFLGYFSALVENYKIFGIKNDKVIKTFVKKGGISTEIHFTIKDFLDNNLFYNKEYPNGTVDKIPLDDYIMSQIKIRIYV